MSVHKCNETSLVHFESDSALSTISFMTCVSGTLGETHNFRTMNYWNRFPKDYCDKIRFQCWFFQSPRLTESSR